MLGCVRDIFLGLERKANAVDLAVRNIGVLADSMLEQNRLLLEFTPRVAAGPAGENQ